MKKYILPFFLSFPLFLHAQSGVFGLYLGNDAALNSNTGVASVDGTTGDVNYIHAFLNTDIHAFGDHAADSYNKQFYQVTGDSVNMYLMNFDMSTGELTNILFVVDSVGDGTPGTVTIGGNIGGVFYNCGDGMVYFFHYKAPWEAYVHFARVNPFSAIVTELDSFPLGIQPIDNDPVPTHQVAYWFEYNSAYIFDHIRVYDLINLTSSTVNLSSPIPVSDNWQVTYNPIDGLLYGLAVDLDSFGVNNYLADLRFIRVDPVSGQVDNLTADFYGNYIGSNISLDFNLDQVNALIQSSNPGYPQVCNFDVVSNSYQIHNPSYNNFGTILPTLLGLDGASTTKGCTTVTGNDAPEKDCDDPIFAALDGSAAFINLGCHWKEFKGMHLQLFDLWGRQLSDSRISGSTMHIDQQNLSSAVYFYCITNGSQLKSSGKLMVAH